MDKRQATDLGAILKGILKAKRTVGGSGIRVSLGIWDNYAGARADLQVTKAGVIISVYKCDGAWSLSVHVREPDGVVAHIGNFDGASLDLPRCAELVRGVVTL